MSFSALVSAFNDEKLHLECSGSLFRIRDSSCLPISAALRIISRVKYYPLISQNRIEGRILFTLVPYRTPTQFDKLDVKRKLVDPDEARRIVESTVTPYQEFNEPIIINGKQIHPSLAEARKRMAESCNQISAMVIEYIDKVDRTGKVLDLGCGIGANSYPFLEKKWSVTAIDNVPLALDLFRKEVDGFNGKSRDSESQSLQMIEADITTYKFAKNHFDLVVCIDVLPYINSKKLYPLIKKIHDSLVSGGQLIGTLFFSASNQNDVVKELMGKLGAHFYPDNSLIPEILEQNGFVIEECSIRVDDDHLGPMCIEFVAKKGSDLTPSECSK